MIANSQAPFEKDKATVRKLKIAIIKLTKDGKNFLFSKPYSDNVYKRLAVRPDSFLFTIIPSGLSSTCNIGSEVKPKYLGLENQITIHKASEKIKESMITRITESILRFELKNKKYRNAK